MNNTVQNYIYNKTKMLNWADQFNIFCMLDSNNYTQAHSQFECILAVGVHSSYNFTGHNDFEKLQQFYINNPSWLFGHLGYNAAGNAYKHHTNDENEFSPGFFFAPYTIIQLNNEGISILKSEIDKAALLQQILQAELAVDTVDPSPINIIPFFTKQKYKDTIATLQKHIKRGDCYEINFCKPFMANDVQINATSTYLKLTQLSPTPFAALYKHNHKYCICASPERYLQKKGTTLLSQPIKGTSMRSEDTLIDHQSKLSLLNSPKEKSENVMVVDLVRNDLSTICTKASVQVKELFGLYSFAQVHQMISTVVGQLHPNTSFTKAIAACYPMGSMTGAPKQKVMELIETYEPIARGLFSGCIGYIKPPSEGAYAEPDFDFNVVIRSIFYNKQTCKLHFFAGSGITFYSDAEAEYHECLAKAKAIITVLKA